MGSPTRFDLTCALATWRRALRQNDAISDDQVEELESHLMDVMSTLNESGLSTEEAFLVARRRVGDVRALQREYEKNTWWPGFVAGVQRFVMVTGATYLAVRAAALLYIAASGGLAAADMLRFHLVVEWTIIGVILLLITGLLAPELTRRVHRWWLGAQGFAAPGKRAGRAEPMSRGVGMRSLFPRLCRWVLPTLVIAFVLPGVVLHGIIGAHLESDAFHLGIGRALLVVAVLFLLFTDLPHALYRRAYRKAATYLLFVPWLAAFAIALADSDLLNPATVVLGVAYPCLIMLLLYRRYSEMEQPPERWAIA